MKDIGKRFEDRVRNALAEAQASTGLFFHKLKDSHSAGRVVGNSPSDFLVGLAGQAQLWECKASEIHASLRNCCSSMVSDNQVGHHTLWHKNRLKSFFLFYSDLTGWVEIWDGTQVVEARVEGKPLPTTCPLETKIEVLGMTIPLMFDLRRHYDPKQL